MLEQGLTAGSPNLHDFQDGDVLPLTTKIKKMDPPNDKECWIMITG
jgi:hypothetical protein